MRVDGGLFLAVDADKARAMIGTLIAPVFDGIAVKLYSRRGALAIMKSI